MQNVTRTSLQFASRCATSRHAQQDLLLKGQAMAILAPLIGLVLLGGPCAIAVWIAMRFRSPVAAFFLAWVTTPFLTLGFLILLWPVLRATIPSNNDGTAVIMIPFFGIVTGLVSAIVAAVLVDRRRQRQATMPGPTKEPNVQTPPS